jgi:hypothetical protein
MPVEHTIVLGDWSGDGHEKTHSYLFTTPNHFTDDILGANYKKSVAELKIDPTKFAKEYEDSTLPEDVFEALQKYGFDVSVIDRDGDDGNAYVYSDTMFQILMFLIGYSLDGFEWELRKPPKPLIGTWQAEATGSSFVGYGLF